MTPNEWLQDLLKVITDIADKNYQLQAWLGNKPSYVSSWQEMVCMLFDHCDIDLFLEGPWKEAGLDAMQWSKLKTLRDTLDAIDYAASITPLEILEDPAWNHAVSVAQAFLSSLKTPQQPSA